MYCCLECVETLLPFATTCRWTQRVTSFQNKMYCTAMAKASSYSYQHQEVVINKLTVDAPNHGKARR